MPITICYTVLLFYDYILTLDKEVGLFWKKRISGASLLFLCNRYLTLLTQMFDMVQFTTDMSDEVRVCCTLQVPPPSHPNVTVRLTGYVLLEVRLRSIRISSTPSKLTVVLLLSAAASSAK